MWWGGLGNRKEGMVWEETCEVVKRWVFDGDEEEKEMDDEEDMEVGATSDGGSNK